MFHFINFYYRYIPFIFNFGAAEAGTPFRSSDHDPVLIGVSGAATPVEVDLLTINDFHGRLEAAPPVAGAAALGQ